MTYPPRIAHTSGDFFSNQNDSALVFGLNRAGERRLVVNTSRALWLLSWCALVDRHESRETDVGKGGSIASRSRIAESVTEAARAAVLQSGLCRRFFALHPRNSPSLPPSLPPDIKRAASSFVSATYQPSGGVRHVARFQLSLSRASFQTARFSFCGQTIGTEWQVGVDILGKFRSDILSCKLTVKN